ncbi:tetratricopeptide repeat protein [Segnochrobactraceae bacterium EtOH-i3]
MGIRQRFPLPRSGLLLLALLSAGAGDAWAQTDTGLPGIRLEGLGPAVAAPEAPALKAMSPTDLLIALRRAPDARAARPYVREIERRRGASGSDTVDLLMDQALRASRDGQTGRALDLLDAALRIRPDFSAAHVRRALVRFQSGDAGGAVEDLAAALEADPDNWTALEGIAAVFVSLGDEKSAAVAYDEALAINPWLTEAREARDKLTPDVDGREI